MTKQEATYWKNFIIQIVEERLPQIELSDLESLQISEFEKKHMPTITGQQMLPQSVFREFLRVFSPISAIQGEILQAQEACVAMEERLQEYIDGLDDYAALTDEELDAIVNGEEEEESGEQEEAETQVDTRPRIEAYNAGLDVRKELRRVSYNTSLHVATWEDSTTGDNWYTNYPYELGGNVWDNSNIYSAPAWGVISLISE